MELELGLRITHNRDDLTSKMADFKITKDLSGPLFMSSETESKFILIGHLKGFRRENIDIRINETGNRIAISGKKPVQEMVLMGWIMCRKEVEVRGFRKVFRIPERVKLDKIKAKLNDETSTLTIVMPKSEKGVSGVVIEEVEEEEEDRGRIEADKAPGIEKAEEEIQKESEKPIEKEENNQVVEREVPETIHQKNGGLGDFGQFSEKVSDQGGEYAGEAVTEKPEASKEKISLEEQRVDQDESRKLPNEAEKVPERVEEQVKEETKEPEIKRSEENDQVMEKSHGGPETEPQASTDKEEAAEKASDRSQKTEPRPTEETQRENHTEERAQVQELEELVCSPENTEYKNLGGDQVTAPMEPSNSKSNEIEEEETTQEKYQLENEKPGEEVQESTKPGSHQETERQKTSNLNNLADQASEEAQGKEHKETETREETSEEKAEEHASRELKEQKSQNEKATGMKKQATRKSKIPPPLVVAGSALLVSIVVLVFNFLRAKKR